LRWPSRGGRSKSRTGKRWGTFAGDRSLGGRGGHDHRVRDGDGAGTPAPAFRPAVRDRFRHRPGAEADQEAFRALVASAVEQHPGTAEAAAGEDEALAGLSEARSAVLPTLDATVTSYRIISREFSDDPTNVIERSRPEQRTDAILAAQQTLFDFGATSRRVSAAGGFGPPARTWRRRRTRSR
jgi:adhesin transport system outer membrane protein